MTINEKRKRLIKKFQSKKYRDAFVVSYIEQGIRFQIKAIREQQGLTQEDLARQAGMQQERISALENPNTSGLSLKTLKKLAAAFDVGLVVRFVPLGDLIEWDVNLSSKSLNVPRFEDDPYFKEKDEKETALSDSNQYIGITPTASNNVIYLKDHKLAKTSVTMSEKTMPGTIAEGV